MTAGLTDVAVTVVPRPGTVTVTVCASAVTVCAGGADVTEGVAVTVFTVVVVFVTVAVVVLAGVARLTDDPKAKAPITRPMHRISRALST
ncbi:hypothetical protein [Propionibacterium sp.]|uniref:hypothetical protein n=1 Tax=Propionibacterium sp. TaxID=1977903 RepID=UPI0039EACE6A